MDPAFVLSTPVRRAVFLDLCTGETDLDRVVAKNRLLRPAAERAAKEFVERGLVEKVGDAWKVTAEGMKLRAVVQRDFLAGGG